MDKTLKSTRHSSKSDLEDARKNANLAQKKLKELNEDPRRQEIPIHIRAHEEKIEKIKRVIEDDQGTVAAALNELSCLYLFALVVILTLC